MVPAFLALISITAGSAVTRSRNRRNGGAYVPGSRNRGWRGRDQSWRSATFMAPPTPSWASRRLPTRGWWAQVSTIVVVGRWRFC